MDFGIIQYGGQGKKAGKITDDKKKKLDAFLAKSKERREEISKKFEIKRQAKKERESKQKIWGQKMIAAEKAELVRKKEAMIQWRKDEKKRKEDVQKMLLEKKAEIEHLEEKKKKKHEEEKQKKAYMKTMQWANALKMAKDKRKKKSVDMKQFAMADAEHDYKRDTQHSRNTQEQTIRDIKKQSEKDRGDADSQEEFLYGEIETDIRQRRSKLFAKEQVETAAMKAEMMRKKSILRTIQDPSLRMRTKAEMNREETMKKKKIEKKYLKLKTDIEVERNKRRDDVKLKMKKQKNTIAAIARTGESEAKKKGSIERTAIYQKYQKDKKAADEIEKEIMSMNLVEALAVEEEKDMDED